jgi:hypothetical protein
MLPNSVKREIQELFEEALDEKRKRIYFDKYHAGRSLESVSLVQEFEDELQEDSIEQSETNLQNADVLSVDGEPVLFLSHRDEAWIVIYSSRIDEKVRNKLGDLASIKGWLIEAWIPGSTLDDIYREYSPDGESISLKKSWDPYYLYKRESKIPDKYKEYYSENPREFSQQNVNVEITTPKWRLNETMEHAMTPFLEENSETERSEFTMEASPSTGVSSDGGTASKTQSSVRVKESGEVTHQSGDIGATFTLVDETAERSQWIYDQFEDVCASYEFSENEDGSLTLSGYNRPKALEFRVHDAFSRNISIKLSNFLVMGQKDVDLYGVVADREGKEFSTKTNIPFNNDEYDIYVTGIDDDEKTAVYVRPVEGSVSGLVYFYHKLLQKFDPNINVSTVESIPKIPNEG